MMSALILRAIVQLLYAMDSVISKVGKNVRLGVRLLGAKSELWDQAMQQPGSSAISSVMGTCLLLVSQSNWKKMAEPVASTWHYTWLPVSSQQVRMEGTHFLFCQRIKVLPWLHGQKGWRKNGIRVQLEQRGPESYVQGFWKETNASETVPSSVSCPSPLVGPTLLPVCVLDTLSSWSTMFLFLFWEQY